MKRLLLTFVVVAVAATACQKDVVYHDTPKQNQSLELPSSNTRSYDEALAIAEDALKLLEGDDTRSTTKRVIKRNEGQTVMRPVTRGSETQEEPIMYVFNNEDNQGFTIVAADRSKPSLIAVTEYGNYTYGEPTGVEPFDLLMEDVAKSLIIFPEEPFAIKEERENEVHEPYGPLTTVQWGVGTIYGAMYPDGTAYDEATAIAQALLCTATDDTYVVTNPNDAMYGQVIPINKPELSKHLRYNYHGFTPNACSTNTHNQISQLFLEIGYRLSNGTTVDLANKNLPFTLSRVHSVLSSFGANLLDVRTYGELHASILGNPIIVVKDRDAYVFRGIYSNSAFNAHTWLATGRDDFSYDLVEYTLNKILNPNHSDPLGYTETNRVKKYDYMLYMNWGYDGYSNGWFNSGCFDMSARVDGSASSIGGTMPTLDYNFVDIELFTIDNPAIIYY